MQLSVSCMANDVVPGDQRTPDFQACVSQTTRKLYGAEKPFVKLRTAYSVKLVFSYVVKGIKVKITAKFRDTGHLRFEDTKRIMSPETCPKSVGTFEKRAPGESCQRTDNPPMKTHRIRCVYAQTYFNQQLKIFACVTAVLAVRK